MIVNLTGETADVVVPEADLTDAKINMVIEKNAIRANTAKDPFLLLNPIDKSFILSYSLYFFLAIPGAYVFCMF